MIKVAFDSHRVQLPDGWFMRRLRLDDRFHDVHGWDWGPGDPVFIMAPEGVDDTLSVRAPCPVIAVALVTIDRWPPLSSKRFRWEYQR